MPCRDFYDDHPQAYFKDVTEPALKKQVAFAESALCQTLAALERCIASYNEEHGTNRHVLDQIDYAAAGITKSQLSKWWNEHKELDAKHREAKRIEKLKISALAKLTVDEQKALGLVK